MPEIGDLLERAAASPSGHPEVERIAARAAGRRRTRRAGTGLALGLLLVAVVATAVVVRNPATDDEQLYVGEDGETHLRQLLGVLPQPSQLPEAEEGRWTFSFSDLDVAATAAGIQRARRGAPPEAVAADRDALMAEGGAGSGGVMIDPSIVTELRSAELGIGFEEVRAWASIGQMPFTVSVIVGDFDLDAIDEATRSDPDYGPLLEHAEHAGYPYRRWSVEANIVGPPTPARSLGVGGQLYASEDLVIWTLDSRAMHATLDVLAGEAPSLAADPDVAALTTSLERLGVHTGSVQPELPAPGAPFDLPEDPSARAIPEIERYSLGRGRHDGRPVAVVALAVPPDAVEEAFADVLEQLDRDRSPITGLAWRDRLTLIEVSTTGRVVEVIAEPTGDPQGAEILLAEVVAVRSDGDRAGD